MTRNRPGALTPVAMVALLALAPVSIACGDGPRLTDEDLIQSARANNRQIQMAVIDSQQGSVDVTRARAMRGPQITGTLDFSYLTNPVDPITIRAGELGTYDLGGVSTLVPPEDVRVYDGMEPTLFRLTGVVEQPLYTWGKLNLGVRLAEESVVMRSYQHQALELEIVLNLVSAATAARYLVLMDEVAADQVSGADELVRLARAAVETGTVVQTALLEVQVAAQKARLVQQEIANERDGALLTLRRHTGLAELAAADLCQPRLVPDGIVANVTGPGALKPADELVHAALAVNPGLAGLAQVIQVSGTRTELAAATDSRRPDLGLRMELSLVGPRVPFEPDWYGKDEFNLTASIAVQSTLFDSGLGKAETESAALDEMSAQGQFDDSALALETQIRELVLTVELAQARINYLSANAELLSAQLEVRRREFDAGVGSRDGVVRGELAVLANELELLSELLAIETAIAALALFTGAPVGQVSN
jgi:outer membrane protein